MGIEEIVRSLRSEAEEESRLLVERARERASEILSDARMEAEAESRSRLVEAEESARAEARSRTAAARKALAMDRAKLVDQAVGRVFTSVRSAIPEVRQMPDYPEILARLLEEAVAGGSDEHCEIVAHPGDLGFVREIVRRKGLPAAIKPDPSIQGGVRVNCSPVAAANVSQDEILVIMDNSLEGRLERASTLYRGAVARRLFGDDDG